MKIDELIEKLEGVQQRGAGYVALCPAHEDSTPSLSVDETDDGNLLLKCHAGCTFESIAKAVGMNGGHAEQPEAVYDYTDERASLLFQVVRLPGKQFRQRQPDGNGGWIYKMDGVRRVPYRLAEVLAAIEENRIVVITEGEKDADAIKKHGEAQGIVGTTSPGGSGSWKKEYARFFEGGSVRIIADKDYPGKVHASEVFESLQGIAKEVAVYEAKEGKDAFDHLETFGLPFEDFVPINLSGYTDETQLSEVKAKHVDWHIEPFVQVSGFHLLVGDGGIGKGTWLAYLTAAVTQGATDHKLGPKNVLIVSSEDSIDIDLKPRIMAAGGDCGRVFALKKHILLPRDIPYLEKKIQQQRNGVGTGLVIIDPIANHIGGVSGDEEGAVRHAINELNFVADRTGCSIFGVRHLTKSGATGTKAVLGSVAWVNTPRIVLSLTPHGNGGAVRILKVEKSNRGKVGNSRQYKLGDRFIDEAQNTVPVISAYPAPEDIPSTQEARDDPWFQSQA